MTNNDKRNAQQVVVIIVAATVCFIAAGGFVIMAVLDWRQLDVSDALDKYSTAALVAAIGLLSKLSDSRAEAKDAAAAAVSDTVKDLAKLDKPDEVTGPGGGPVRVAEVPAGDVPPPANVGAA
jgi:hypothetical protein